MTEITGHPMYAISLNTDHYEINLIFHDFKFQLISMDTPITDKAFINPLDKTFIHKK